MHQVIVGGEVTPVYDEEQGIIPFEDLVVPANTVPADERANYMWIASIEQLEAWLDLHNSYKVKERILEAVAEKISADNE